MLAQLTVGLRGWVSPVWAEDYFPEDLPADWRLGYLSNEFFCALATPAELAGQTSEDLEEWLDDVSVEFRFVLEAVPGEQGLVSQLGDALLCQLGESDATTFQGWPLLAPCELAGSRQKVWCAPEWTVALWEVDTLPSPAAMRVFVEKLDRGGDATQVVLVFDGKAAPEAARQARVIGDFMGL